MAGITLMDSARFYLRHHRPEPGGWTVKTAYDMYIKHLEEPEEGSPARPRTLTDKRTRLSSFVELWGATPIERITEPAVSDWLTSTGAQGRNLRNNTTQVQSLFNFCESNAPGEYNNTVARFPQARSKETAPAETVTPAHALAVLHALEVIDPRSALTLAQHYKGKAVRKQDAKAFFGILPQDAQDNLIHINA